MPKTDHRVQLTPTKIAGLKPALPGQRYQVMDALVPGFGVRVTDTGVRTFILRTRFPGSSSPARREIGKAGDMSLTDARDKARQWRDLVRQGIDPTEQEARDRAATVDRRRMTFGSVAEDFIREKLPSERKGKDAEREIRRDLLPEWQNLALGDVTDLRIVRLIKAKGHDGKVGARNLLALIKRLFRWVCAQPEYGLPLSPCSNIRATDILGEMPRSKARILTNDEMFALWRAAGRLPYPVGPAYRLLMLTALRLNEAVDASWAEFNLREGIWVIPAERMKGRNSGKKQARAHAVPLTDDILAIIKGLPRWNAGRYLFSTIGGESSAWIGTKIKQRLDRRMLRTLRALARQRGEDPATVTLPHFVNHDIRRTVRSQLSRLKITEEAREAVLAHARPGIKGTYDHHDYLEEKREALELWAARLRDIVMPRPNNLVQLRAIA
jgi:integrase